MESGTYKCWSYSVHIVSDSTISFRESSKKKKPSLLPEYHLREQVHGSSQTIMSGCMAPELKEEAMKSDWAQHPDYRKTNSHADPFHLLEL
eukprot:847631-Pyramimonas_sp.AAC.1